MAQQIINLGASPNDGTGDSLRVGGEKINENFTELYAMGNGTVTSVSAGSLSPLFATNVATPSTTPAITFTLSNAAQNAVLAGPATGGAGAPTYRALVAADIPSLSSIYQPLDADLTAIAALGFTATAFLTKTAANTWALDTTVYLPISGGTLTGALTLNADPTNALHAATKQYVDGLVVGLWDDRGNFDASGGAYPSSGGSGTGGAILKGDVWTISVAGTLPTGQVVQIGDTVRALIDTPGNTQANWAIGQTNFTYTAGNGLTLTGADEFKLGGVISENTTFSGSGFNITWGSSGTRLGNYRVWSNGTIGLDGNTTAFLQTGGNTIATTTAGISVGTVGPILLNTNTGTAGQVLTSAGAADPPTWSAIGSGSVDNTIWKVGGNMLSGAAILGSTSAHDITMTVGNANYKLSVNGAQVVNVDSAGGILFAVGGGTISLTTAFDFRARTGDTRVLRMANQANTTLWTLGTANGEMFMGTGSNTFIGPGSLGSASATGTGIVYRATQSTGHYFLIGASNMGNFAQIDENTTAGNMIGVSSTTGQWHRVRPSFDNSTGTSVAYTFFQLSPTINLTGGSTTLRGYAFTPTMTSSTGGSLAAFLHTAGYVAWDSVLSPSQITSNQNDYNPTGWNNGGAPHGASILRLNTDASRNLTSLTGGASGRLAIIANVGSFDLVLKNDDGATGTAANRFALNADVTLQAGKCALIWYDGTSSRWRINGF